MRFSSAVMYYANLQQKLQEQVSISLTLLVKCINLRMIPELL